MKIFGLEHNYRCDDNSASCPQQPVLIQLFDISMLASGKPFILPDDGHEYRAYPSVAVRIDRLGKGIRERFATRYYSEATFGLSIRDVTLLRRLRANGEPWDEAVSFDGSAPLGLYTDAALLFAERARIRIELSERTADRPFQTIEYSPDRLMYGIDRAIEMVSRKCTVKNGDIVFAGFMPDGFELYPGLDIRCYLNERQLLFSKIR